MQRLFEFSVLQGKLLKWEIAMFERSYLACTLAFSFPNKHFTLQKVLVPAVV